MSGDLAKRTSAWVFAMLVSSPFAGFACASERVTIDNFTRVNSDFYFKSRVDQGCFATICHDRGPTPIEAQVITRLNRDTPYSAGVFDLTSPVTITMPDAGRRFQSMMVINEDHYVPLVAYKPGSYTLTAEAMGTRYVQVMIRTFMDPNDPADMTAGHALQDRIRAVQSAPGKFDVPDWDQAQREQLQGSLLRLAPFVTDSRNMFGTKAEVDPVRHLVGTAGGWGGNSERDALYINVTPKDNDGRSPMTLTVKDVPVDGFWSVTVYNAKGLYEAPETAISINNVTALKDGDGQITIHFGGDPMSPNYLHIMPGWNYTVRLYRPQVAILDGSWIFPEARRSN